MSISAEQAAKLLEDGESWSDSNVEVITDLARALIASEAARKLAEERLAKAVEVLEDIADGMGETEMIEVGRFAPHVARALLKEIDNG